MPHHPLKPINLQLMLQHLLTLLPPQHQHINHNRQQRTPRLHQPNIPTNTLSHSLAYKPTHQMRTSTYLHITKPPIIHLAPKLPLNRPRPRTTRPPPQIIALPPLILLPTIQPRSNTPHHRIPRHDHPAKRTRHITRDIRFRGAEFV